MPRCAHASAVHHRDGRDPGHEQRLRQGFLNQAPLPLDPTANTEMDYLRKLWKTGRIIVKAWGRPPAQGKSKCKPKPQRQSKPKPKPTPQEQPLPLPQPKAGSGAWTSTQGDVAPARVGGAVASADGGAATATLSTPDAVVRGRAAPSPVHQPQRVPAPDVAAHGRHASADARNRAVHVVARLWI